MYPPQRSVNVGEYTISMANKRLTITGPPDKAQIKYAKDYAKQYGYKYPGSSKKMTIASVHYSGLDGCCSGHLFSRLTFIKGIAGKQPTVVMKVKYLRMMLDMFNHDALVLYIARSDNAKLTALFKRAGWKKSRGPVGKYSPYNYTLDTYTVDPRTPKHRLPPLNKSKKVVAKKEAPIEVPVVYIGWRKYFGFSVDNIRRRLGEFTIRQ